MYFYTCFTHPIACYTSTHVTVYVKTNRNILAKLILTYTYTSEILFFTPEDSLKSAPPNKIASTAYDLELCIL